MNSSGPGLRGSQGEARSPACVCSGQEQKFPCKVAPTPPPPPLQPSGASWDGEVGRGPGLQRGELAACRHAASSCPTLSQHQLGQGRGEASALRCPRDRKLGLGDKIPTVALGMECRDTDDRSCPVSPVQSTVPWARLTPSPSSRPAQSPADGAFWELTGHGQALENTAEPAPLSERNGTNSGPAELSMRPRAGAVFFEPLSLHLESPNGPSGGGQGAATSFCSAAICAHWGLGSILVPV